MGGVQVELHLFLTSALDGGEWSSSDYDRSSEGADLLVPTE
jgi:hypothetical protein